MTSTPFPPYRPFEHSANALRIIVIEDHDQVRESLITFLQRPHWQVRGAEDGAALDQLLRQESADIVVIDLNLPGEDGLSICERLRTALPDAGLVMLTARILPKDKTAGYRSGADVYLTKPANVGELEAVITNLSRRIQPKTPPAWQLDLHRQQLLIPRLPDIKLTKAETELLYLLSVAPDRQLDSDVLTHRLGNAIGSAVHRGHLAVIISRLRARLMQAGWRKECIKGQRRQGYQLLETLILIN